MVSAAMPIPNQGLFGRIADGIKNVGSKYAPKLAFAKTAGGAVTGSLAHVAAAGAGFVGGQLNA